MITDSPMDRLDFYIAGLAGYERTYAAEYAIWHFRNTTKHPAVAGPVPHHINDERAKAIRTAICTAAFQDADDFKKAGHSKVEGRQ